MYLLQDAQTLAATLGFSLHKDILMVAPFLEQKQCADLLTDPRLVGATKYVQERNVSTGQRYDRGQVEAAVKEKQQLVNIILDEYSKRATITRDELIRCIDSLSDAISLVETNLAPVKRMLHLLETHFTPEGPTEGYSLQLSASNSFTSRYSSASSSRFGLSPFRDTYGVSSSGGSTLNHSHSTQYTFVWQSLRLWCKTQLHMHRLWVCADEDLLSTQSSYHLYNTGQGLNRVQACPRVGKVMRSLLHQTQQETSGPWVGLSVIHLGDRDVPNALVFIDKYTQIPRFLHPICDFIDGVEASCQQDTTMDDYVKSQFHSPKHLQRLVLQDYFKHGFDGSGDDGGSCIDGRLTSSWNWTSRIVKKPYYHVFMLSGFQGFDGEFK